MQLATWTRQDISYKVLVFSNLAQRHGFWLEQKVNCLKSAQKAVLVLKSEQEGRYITQQWSKLPKYQNCLPSLKVISVPLNKKKLSFKRKQYHVLRGNTEAELDALVDGSREVQLLQEVTHFAYTVDKRIFKCKNTPISCYE